MSILAEKVILHPDDKNIKLDFRKLNKFIKDNTALNSEVSPIRFKKSSLKNIAEEFALCRIRELGSKATPQDIDYELRYLSGKASAGALYDGFRLSLCYQGLIKLDDNIHIVLTNRLVATYDDAKRLHARSNILAPVSIISFSGIVEGPAKPKEYYAIKHKFTVLGLWEQNEPMVKEKFKKKFIDYGDKRIVEVVKGFILQAIVFAAEGEAFCKDKKCRLFNAHWQEDLIFSQVKSGVLCARHKKIINSIKEGVKNAGKN